MNLIVNVVYAIVNFYSFVLFIYVLLSWFPRTSGILRDINNVLGSICEPYLGLFRKIIPPIGGNGMSVDISPILAIVVLQLIVRVIVRIAYLV